MEIIDKKALSAFYRASMAIKTEFSKARFATLIKTFENVYDEDLILDREKARVAISDLPLEFYDYMASSFINNINTHTEYWLMYNSRVDIFITDEISSYIVNKIFETAGGSDSEYLYKGLLALNDESYNLAMIYFGHIDHYVVNYYKGICYMMLNNYSNAIKTFNLFIKGLTDYFSILENNDVGFNPANNPSLMIYRWEVYGALAFLYNEMKYYDLAVESSENALKIHSLETAFNFSDHRSKDGIVATDFEAFVNNYVFCLVKAGDYAKAADFIENVLALLPEHVLYQQQLIDLNARIARHEVADSILRNILPVKRPFNIEAFTKSESIAREKILEDMIVEQIKYGFMVFGKSLELYQDDRIYGRQYYVRGANGILDLLLIDKKTDTIYVVELKRGLAGVEVIDQIEKYMNGLSGEIDKPIKGIICIHQANPELTKLVQAKNDIELFTYHFDFKKLG